MLALIALIVFIILMILWAVAGVNGFRALGPGQPYGPYGGMAVAWWCVLILSLFVFNAFGPMNWNAPPASINAR